MKIISVICQKGGTTKTTTAINLAVEAASRGLEVVIIDLDPQVSAGKWSDIRGEGRAPLVKASPVPYLERTLKAAAENGADLIIVDTAGRAEETALAAARVADLILVPVQPSLVDIKSIESTLNLIRIGGGHPARAILSRVRAGGNRRENAAEGIARLGLEVCPISLGERFAYQDAYAAGEGITEFEPKGKAADEIRQLYMYVSQLLAMSAKGDVSNGRKSRKTSATRGRA
jgi:chromosome partitioning protein